MSAFGYSADGLECDASPALLAPQVLPLPVGGGEMAWYCVRTKPKHEHIAASGLKRNLGLDVFHPRLRMERSTRRGVVRVVEPVFPCYIFVRCNIEECFADIRYVNGVNSFISFGQRIAVVRDAIVDELRQCFESQEMLDAEENLSPGAEVVVGEGAFLGFKAIVLRVMSAKQRVQILLNFLGRTTVAEVDRKSLVIENRSMADLVPSLATARRLV